MIKKITPHLSRILFFIIVQITSPALCNGQDRAPIEITLLSYNTWIGGTNVNDGQIKTLNAVLRSGADIAGISEATDGIGDFLAERLGWYRFITEDNVIISRFPIKRTWTSVKGAGAEIQIEENKIIVVKTVHLYYTPYGPYRACFDTASVSQLINEESTSGRLDEIKSALKSISSYLRNGTPTFLMGDLNVPSHLDWTQTTLDEHCGYVVEWPVTKAVEDSGMTDSYRELYPDPAEYPGITWSPVYAVNENGKPEPLDRIDFIFYAGKNVKALASEIFVVGKPEQIPNHEKNEWPSDHAAVITRFSVDTGTDINSLPTAKFYAGTPVIREEGNISFTDISANKPTSWSWSFDGGNPAVSSEQNPVVSYSRAGNYNVRLIASNAAGSDTMTVKNMIVVKPK